MVAIIVILMLIVAAGTGLFYLNKSFGWADMTPEEREQEHRDMNVW